MFPGTPGIPLSIGEPVTNEMVSPPNCDRDKLICPQADWYRAEIKRLRADARSYANVMLSEENDRLIDEIKQLRAPFRAVDIHDWAFVMGQLGDGDRGRFWKEVLTEMRAALDPVVPAIHPY